MATKYRDDPPTVSPMARLQRAIDRLAGLPFNVLIRGETGVGKERVARALHERGALRDEPFEALNCATLPAGLAESLLFGHERGAFTGADRRARGVFERAGEGTVFLDEIGDLPLELQPKLLRVLEGGTYRPVGADSELRTRARVIAATHVDLDARVADGRFREDLLYRLGVAIDVPSLGDRRDEIADLVHELLGEMPRRLAFTDEALRWLEARAWPGNIRELRRALETLVALSESDIIGVAVLEELIRPLGRASLAALCDAALDQPGDKLELVERALIDRAVARCHGNKAAAARLLGIDRKVLDRRLTR